MLHQSVSTPRMKVTSKYTIIRQYFHVADHLSPLQIRTPIYASISPSSRCATFFLTLTFLLLSQPCTNGKGGGLSFLSSSQHSVALRLMRDFQKSGSDEAGSSMFSLVFFASRVSAS